jgi:hypothetical protein
MPAPGIGVRVAPVSNGNGPRAMPGARRVRCVGVRSYGPVQTPGCAGGIELR